MKLMRLHFTGILSLAVLATLTTTAQAAPATYLFFGVGTGTLGGTSFTNAAFSLTYVGDTDDLFTPFLGVAALDTFSSTAFVIDGTNATLTGPSEVFSNFGLNPESAFVGFTNGGGTVVAGGFLAAPNYALSSSIGPAELADTFADDTEALSTSAGELVFSSVDSLNFQAIVVSADAPEPASLALLLPFAVGVTARRKRNKISRSK